MIKCRHCDFAPNPLRVNGKPRTWKGIDDELRMHVNTTHGAQARTFYQRSAGARQTETAKMIDAARVRKGPGDPEVRRRAGRLP